MSDKDKDTPLPPEIMCEEVPTPVEPIVLQDIQLLSNSSQHMNASVASGSLLAVNRPLELRESALSVNFPFMDGVFGDEDVCLMYTRHEKIPMKDFAAEIRASMDVENFLSQAVLFLDVTETHLDAVLEHMLKELLASDDDQTDPEEFKRTLFTQDSVHQLSKTIQGTCTTYGGGFDYDQSWICALCTHPSLQRRHVAIARLRQPANLGRTSQEVYFIILVIAPTKEKGTKNALETGRTFATLFADLDLRQRLLQVHTEEDFKKLLWEHTKELAEEQNNPQRKMSVVDGTVTFDDFDMVDSTMCPVARGLRNDFMRRIPHYFSDFKDGVIGHKTLQKTASTSVFLYFACILPSIAFGVVNDNNTKGKIDVKKVIYAQSIGGLAFAMFGGQPLIVLLTTAPLALYTKVIYMISTDFNISFSAMYACVGLWNSVFLLIYANFNMSRLMKWSTRSTEEIFALFISLAFTVDAFRDIYNNFMKHYMSPECTVSPSSQHNCSIHEVCWLAGGNNTSRYVDSYSTADHCLRENSLLYLLLTLGTLWIGVSLYNFTKTPFLNASKRELLADYALPVAVLVMSFMGSYVFKDVSLRPFNYDDSQVFVPAPLQKLPWPAVFGAMGLGFILSLLFFMDQNISSAMVNTPSNKLKKGSAYHWDLMVVALINAVLSYFGLPMVHGALPHSPLHVRALADVEERVDQGHVFQRIVHVRETRLTGVLSHIFIGLSLLMLPIPMQYIPRAVLDGLFLYLAVTGLYHSQLFERILLLVTEQAAYPPNHYIRSVPQRKVHLFTFTQLIQLAALCSIGFAPLPYLKMVFPILIMLLLPIRHKLVPLIINKKYLEALDGH